jgi:hypothetical protein
MFLSNTDLTHRVANRFLKSQTETDPHDHAIIWRIPPVFPEIPDDIVVQCSDGCVVTGRDVEKSIAKTIDIIRGSCRFQDVHADEAINRARFEIQDSNGRRLRGTVTVNIVARDDQLTAFSMIVLDGEISSR